MKSSCHNKAGSWDKGEGRFKANAFLAMDNILQRQISKKDKFK